MVKRETQQGIRRPWMVRTRVSTFRAELCALQSPPPTRVAGSMAGLPGIKPGIKRRPGQGQDFQKANRDFSHSFEVPHAIDVLGNPW